MKNASILVLAFACLGIAPLRAESGGTGSDSVGHDLQLGGSVSLDQQSRIDAREDPSMGLHEVALGANVAISDGIEAAVVLKAEDDLAAIFFDQATATLTPPGGHWSLIVGQQAYNHGLLSTRLISDPEILPYLETKLPGVSASWTPGSLSLGSGLVLLETADAGGGTEVSRDFAFIPDLDWNRGPWQARLSGMASRYRNDVDMAATLTAGPIVLDVEGFSRFQAWDCPDRTAGYSVGGQLSLSDAWSAAIRQDGISSRIGAPLSAWRIGTGLSYTFRRDLFAAAEYAYGSGTEAPGHRLALRAGLKSTLHLPGFQRETLTQP